MNNLFSKRSRSKAFQTLIAFAQHVSEGVAFMDLNGTIYYVNAAWAKMHGYAASNELIEKNICFFHTPAQIKNDILPLMEEVTQKGGREITIDHIRSDGSAFETLTKIIAFNNTEGNTVGFAIFVTDLTEYRHFEKCVADLKTDNQQLRQQEASACQTKQSLIEQISEMKNKSAELHKELKNDILDDGLEPDHNREAIPIREIPPFDPKKLRALADLAKRLAKKN